MSSGKLQQPGRQFALRPIPQLALDLRRHRLARRGCALAGDTRALLFNPRVFPLGERRRLALRSPPRHGNADAAIVFDAKQVSARARMPHEHGIGDSALGVRESGLEIRESGLGIREWGLGIRESGLGMRGARFERKTQLHQCPP
jgi:hypothetical protein